MNLFRIRDKFTKSVVERTVQIVEKDLMPEMAKLHLTSLSDYNSILRKKLEKRLEKFVSQSFTEAKKCIRTHFLALLRGYDIIRL